MSTESGDTQLGITDADRERIHEILKTPRMSPETCARVRQRAKNGEIPVEIAGDDENAESQWSESTIRHHARGDCSHEIDTSPAAILHQKNHSPLSDVECARIRRQRANGRGLAAIADEIGCGESTVETHANGRCSHARVETGGGEQA